MKKLAIVLGVLIVVILGILIFWQPAQGPTVAQNASSTQALVSADGHLEVDLPIAQAMISSPVAIEGKVIGGGWFFEASFPIKVLDGNGKVLGTGTAQALGDWMTTGTVPFSASIPFIAPHYATGTILFHNDNPSGLPANDKSLSVPVVFKTSSAATGTSGNAMQGIRGVAVLGPTCPVERIPPDPQCAEKPYAGSLAVTTPDGAQVIKNFSSDVTGAFSIDLPVGSYAIRSGVSTGMLPRCASDGALTVKAGVYTQATISCDTGIR